MIDLFFQNRRLLILVVALIVVTGLWSIHVMPRLEDPRLKQRAALIHTDFPGANAIRVESLINEEIEQALKEVEEIRMIRSVARNESSTITIELHDHVFDTKTVWSRVRDKLNDIQPVLPEGAEAPQFVDLKFAAYAGLFALKWVSDQPINLAVLNRYADLLEQKVRTLAGTDDVDLFGEHAEQIVIEVDQQQIAVMGLTAADIGRAVESSDAKVSAGGLRSRTGNIVVEVNSEFETLDQIAKTPIQNSLDGTVVTLGDIATIEKSVLDPPETLAIVSGQQAIVMGCFVQPAVRIDWWTQEVLKELEAFRAELPQGIELETVFLQEQYVTGRLHKLLVSLALGASAVTFVIFLMMGWRSAVVIGTALPLSGLMVLGGLNLLSIPLHQMSITGLIIALGLLIDNAIVTVDEIRIRMREGRSASAAIIATVRHLSVPLAGSTFTTCLAFAPLALMPGPAGEFVGAIGISVILAVTSSLFLSLTVIPALIGIMEYSIETRTKGHFWNHGVGGPALSAAYRQSLRFLFARPWLGIGLGVLLPVFGFIQARNLPDQFFPASDRDQFQITLQLPPHASIFETLAMASRAREMALAMPEITNVDWFIGESAPAFYYNMLPVRSGLPNYAQAKVQLDADADAKSVIRALQAKLASSLVGTQVIVKQLEQGPPVDSPIMVRVYGSDLDKIRSIGQDVRLVMSQIPGVVTTISDTASSTSKLSLNVDEHQARLANLSHTDIARQLSSALDGAPGGSLLEGTEVLPVRIKLKGEQRSSKRQLDSFDLVSRDDRGQSHRVPLEAIAEWRLIPNNSSIERINGFRMNEVQVYIDAGLLASEVLAEFQRRWDESDYQMPPGYSLDFAGESAERSRAVTNLLASAGVLVVLMVAGLVLSFQSFRLAALIGLVGVLSVGLGLASLWWFGYPFGFMAIVGIMGLVGVAINDSIVVLAALRGDEAARMGNPAAVQRVVFRATRHVLSTTFTTIAGFTPLILAGGGFWPPLAIAIAGGVSGATILALYFAPSAYLLFFGGKKPVEEDSSGMLVPLQQRPMVVEHVMTG